MILLDFLVNFDFFNRPSHLIKTISDKLNYVDKQYYHLDKIRESLYEQLWYRYKPIYLKLCKFLEEKINNDFDFDIVIKADTEPIIYDGTLEFCVQAEYDSDIVWEETNRMVELLSRYAYEFNEEHNCDDIFKRLSISELCTGLSEYE